jgi:hypothetical protein
MVGEVGDDGFDVVIAVAYFMLFFSDDFPQLLFGDE